MLHIVNGGATAEVLQRTSIDGEIFSFRDALIDGPSPGDVGPDEWRNVRAQHLSDGYEVARQDCEEGLREQEQVLASSGNHDEVVLWFEHDLFCQLNLLYMLDWFARTGLSEARVSLINVGEFPGRPNFRGLGELTPEELARLFPQRRALTASQLEVSTRAWQAFCAPDPNAIENLLQSDTSAMPFLSTALLAHLRRFPSTTNGLNRIENRSLELIESGSEKFVELFPKFIAAESVYGLGDAQVWLALRNLASADKPLLVIKTAADGNQHSPNNEFFHSSFELTDTGRSVLAGEVDFVALNGIDRWLGGVHLSDDNTVWRWNEDTGRLVSDKR